MAYIGGDITEITASHPTIGSATFYPKSGEDGSFDPGGFRSDDEAEGITGSGEMIDTMKNKRWSLRMGYERSRGCTQAGRNGRQCRAGRVDYQPHFRIRAQRQG